MIRLRFLKAAAVLFALTACSKTQTFSTSLAVTVASDLAVGTEVNRLEVDYESASVGKTKTQHLDLGPADVFPKTLIPMVSGAPVDEVMRIRVTALLNSVPKVSQRFTAVLIKDKHAEITVHLNRICTAMVTTCDDATRTCVDGACVEVPQLVVTLRMDAGAGMSGEPDALAMAPPPDGAEATPDAPAMKAECANDSDCPTSHCVDGLCCDTACTEKCRACNLPGKRGTCSPVLANEADPHGICKNEGQCGTNGLCDGAGACAVHGKTKTCGAPQGCTNGMYTQASFCDGAGACNNAVAAACPMGSKCAEGMCDGSCATDLGCNFDSLYCDGNKCKQKLDNGAACVAGKGNTCISGNCVDGVCCGTAGCGACQQCNLNGKGTCSAVESGTMDPQGMCKDQSATSCGTTGRCDGNGACAFYSSDTPCGPASCSIATLKPPSKCNGAGACSNASGGPCPNNLTCLSGTECKGSCGGDGDCASSALYCSAGQCVPKLDNGVACGTGRCASGNCVNGICCNEACTDQGAASCGNNGVCGAGGTCQKYTCTCDGFAMPNPASAGLPNPASYTVGAGFVTDNVTKLVWEQPIDATARNQAAALKYCTDKGGAWRLPTMVELYSLVDFTRSSPAIDVAFPNTPNNSFWTSSPVAGNPPRAWVVYFNNGGADILDVGLSHQVRCVR